MERVLAFGRGLTTRQRTAVAACVTNVFVSICSSCFWYNELDRLNPFPYFTNMLNVVIAVFLVGGALVVTGDVATTVADMQDNLAWRRLVLLGSLSFALQNTLDIISIDGLGSHNSNLTTVFQQAVIPVTLALSRTILGKTLGRWHLAGAALVVGGILVSYLPLVLQVESSDSSASGGGSGDATGVPLGWAVVFLCSRVPQALSNIFSEQALHITAAKQAAKQAAQSAGAGETGADTGTGAARLMLRALLSITLWTNVVALPLNFLFSLLISGSGLDSGGEGGVSAMLADYGGGWRCLFSGSCDAAFHATFPDCPARCESAWVAVLFFSVPGVLFAVSEFHVLQYAGASAYVILAAIELPLQNTIMASHTLMGRLAGDFHPSIIFGIFVMLPGMVLYGLADTWQQQQQQQQREGQCDDEGRSRGEDSRQLQLAEPLLAAGVSPQHPARIK